MRPVCIEDTPRTALRRGCTAGRGFVDPDSPGWDRPCTWAAVEVLAVGEGDVETYLYAFCVRHWLEVRPRLTGLLIGSLREVPA